MNRKNVLQWLENSAHIYPEKIACADPDSKGTYLWLMNTSQAIGSYLTGIIEPREPVTFYLEKSTLALAGMFGAVYAGGFYSLLDTRQPSARLHTILSVLEPKIILTDLVNYDKAVELFGDQYRIEKLEDIVKNSVIEIEKLDAIRAQALDIDPLYVNFTSGSTGTPKGVTVAHRSVIDFVEVFVSTFGITKNDVIGNQAPFDFDVSVKDIFSCMYTAAELQIIPREYFSNPTLLMDFLCERKVTVLVWAVSAMCFVSIMNGFGYKTPDTIRMVLFSGEVMPMKQLKKWQEALGEGVTYVNLYGPTETTCNCTYYVLEKRPYALDEILPIGKAFMNERVFLLDENDKEITEPNKQGELCVCSTDLAICYYKDKEKTDAAFMQNPLNHNYYERMYRTGDLCYYREDGNLVYATRKDFQVKHLGHRIELGEIEAQVQARDGITRACCLYNNVKKRIILFYTGERESKELLTELRDVLPPFMLPNKLERLEEMPLNKNGKIDRNALKKLGGIA